MAEAQNKNQHLKIPDITIGGQAFSDYPFGYKSIWLAIKSESPAKVADAIFDEEHYDYSIDFKIYENCQGWVVILDLITSLVDFAVLHDVGKKASNSKEYWELLRKTDCSDVKSLNMLQNLSKTFGEVCFFINHRVSDCYAWAKFKDGNIIRAFEYQAGHGVVLSIGEATKEEIELNLFYDDYNLKSENNAPDRLSPTEEDVISIASAWSLSPRVARDMDIELL